MEENITYSTPKLKEVALGPEVRLCQLNVSTGRPRVIEESDFDDED